MMGPGVKPWLSGGVWVALVLMACLLLTACGFQLRGAAGLPPEMARTAVTGLGASDSLVIDLQLALRAGGVELAPLSGATAELRIHDLSSGRRALSVGRDAQVSEYEVFTRLRYSVRGRGNDFEIREQTLTLTRDYLFDPEGVLGQAEQEQSLRESMRRDLVQLILLRLQAAARDH
ncbi:LPS assembly lipoprotein LptE [Ectothiorhodospira lacustris]|uniref:LPS-assembly lipoprotein LptE n=1 Tax=Ectothiorhodospira lacustris TaxID=2899127 RepID=UPI001EE855D0|nr:LPS assembly lipoprotein LptE [Ectothiorhodospira lacustris]MCG5500650.1 LPS assembly lipoprotein LptE [Ectothiorhodospira lacustris]MCG5508959.1 LPS assembly lipoprotein LptE [Ectothiorhodospira lacustris]MCG5520750.1 LPS assembly lipoprotein LptE [Ectothiorhodospira lacustris]